MWTRKAMLAAAAGSALAAAGCGGEDEEQREREARTAADRDIVQVLLEVERLSGVFWQQVVGANVLAQVEGAAELAAAIARNHRLHVETLERFERRLGGEARAAPQADFAKVVAAGPREVLRSGAELGNLSAAAYLGQANRIQDRNLLAAVLALHTVEGRQAAAVARLAGEEGLAFPGGAFAEPMSSATLRRRLRRFAAA